MNLRAISSKTLLALCLILTGSLNIAAHAQVVIAPTKPVIGSSNTVSADPPVVRPDTQPCTVALFTNQEFADFNTKTFTYTPPASCPGPWSKVVFTADFTVTAGRQFDRTAQFFLGGANLFFGTTAEPRKTLSPSWHVESDVTDLSALFNAPQPGTALLGNFVGTDSGVDYTGIIYANATLLFYPASGHSPAPKAPDVVVGLPGNSGAATLGYTSSQLTQAVTLPKNVESIYLDVIAQSQSNDEFWYLCVPDDLASELYSCGSTAFRETEISIDGIPAGVAPIYPWIYTGGIDPYLWEPVPGVQTLNFKPFRVNLTPFAGVLSDGKPHNVALSVFNADSYFAVTANLLAFTDKGSRHTTGEVTINTLAAAPKPVVTNNIATDAEGNITGSVSVASRRKFLIQGKLNTSHGIVHTIVEGNLDFSNTQSFVINQTEYKQSAVQTTTGRIKTITNEGRRAVATTQDLTYPFSFVYDQLTNADGTTTINNSSKQKYFVVNTSTHPDGWPGPPFVQVVANEVNSNDALQYDANFNLTSHGGNSSQTYLTNDSTGYCYGKSLTSKDSVLTGAKSICSPRQKR